MRKAAAAAASLVWAESTAGPCLFFSDLVAGYLCLLLQPTTILLQCTPFLHGSVLLAVCAIYS